MAQADSNNTTAMPVDPTRRRFITIVAAGAAAIATTSPAMAGVAEPDPIFAALDAYNREWTQLLADKADDDGERCCAATQALVNTRPTTPAGLAALTTWFRNESDGMCGNSLWPGERICALSATIDDSARGMSGLKPWSPAPTAAALGQHPDAELFAAIERYYEASREYDIRLRTFSKVELIEPRPRGYVSKERAYLRSMNHYGRAEREVAAIRAKTLEGLIAKANAANNELCPSEYIQLSVAEDVLGMQPGRGKAVV